MEIQYKHPDLMDMIHDEFMVEKHYDTACDTVRHDSDEVGEMVELLCLNGRVTVDVMMKFVKLTTKIKAQYDDELERIINDELCNGEALWVTQIM